MGVIKFKINGEEDSVKDGDVSSDMTLVDYLRIRRELQGTKYMCREGGCGACIVSVVTSAGATPKSVNSCLISIMQCHGWEITTIEKVGNKLDGYHSIQKKLAENNGTQCGHCTPGWVMAMYSLAQSKKEMTQLEIENSFASNVCRCTGYRPIMDTFKMFAVDAPDSKIADIEDLYVCKKTNRPCRISCNDEDDWCVISNESLKEEEPITIELKDGKKWYRVTESKQIFDVFGSINDEDYMLVCGNTAKGAIPIDEYPNILIDVSEVSDLKGHEIDQNLIIGANTTLTDLLEIFEDISKEENFEYLLKLHDHIKLIAHIPVRNVGSIAGNLMTKHKHNSFPSDMFLLLETVGAYVTIIDSNGKKQTKSMQDFLITDMKKKILYNIMLPPLQKSECKLVTFKIMPRAQNAHAIVNAGILFKLLQPDNNVKDVRIVYGGLSPTFIRANKTEKHLKGKNLFQNDTLQSALKVLENEIEAVENLPSPSPEFRKQLALALFYKGLLTLCPDVQLGEKYKSGPKRLHESRPVSKSKQEFSTDPKIYPVNQPMQKVEGLIQCAGEAKYTEDLPTLNHEVFAAFVMSTIGLGNIQSIDPSEALKIPGVITFYSAKDVPGRNNFTDAETLFCADKVNYYNQPLGIVVAKSAAIAERAAKRVKVNYTNVQKPVIDIKIAKDDENRTKLFLPIPNIGRGLFVKKKFKNNYTIGAQMHFCMENIVCVSIPTEFGFDVHSSTQWMDSVQNSVAQALDIDVNRVDVYTRRVGGGFGLKMTRSNLSAVACSLVAYKLNRPCRLIQSFSSIARTLGKRMPCSCDVEVEINDNGRIQYMDCKSFEDNGWVASETVNLLTADAHSNCYNRLWWNFKTYNSITDTAKNAYYRAPGTFEGIAMTEHVMEQISYELSLDPLDVRMTNLGKLLHSDAKKMAEDLKEKAEYDKRKADVETFNNNNRWKKRGIRWALMRFTSLGSSDYEVNMSVNHNDGSVTINHGGIELGQGINTKAIQICAYYFEISVDKIQVKAHNTITAPNSTITGSSITSQSIGLGVQECCKKILKRIKPLRVILLNPNWEKLIEYAYKLKIDLQARCRINDFIAPPSKVYGIALSEVEIDVLTGEHQVLRVDLVEDVGRSVSPAIDLGQVEGAFIMGMSNWTTENVVYDKNTGEVLTDRPWNYQVLQCKDIPQDFRVSFRENTNSDDIVLAGKITGEPAICLGISVPFAIRHAISSARHNAGIPTTEWFTIDGSYTTERICMATATKKEEFLFN